MISSKAAVKILNLNLSKIQIEYLNYQLPAHIANNIKMESILFQNFVIQFVVFFYNFSSHKCLSQFRKD